MPYDSIAQDKAWDIYSRGASLERVAKEMAKEYPGIALRTIEKWSKEFGWKDRREGADAKFRAFVDKLGDGRGLALLMLMDLEDVRGKHVVQLKASTESDAQDIYALNSTTKQMADLLERFIKASADKVAIGVLKSAIEMFVHGIREIDGGDQYVTKHAARIGQLVTAVVEKHGK